jgi:hypothetical protein
VDRKRFRAKPHSAWSTTAPSNTALPPDTASPLNTVPLSETALSLITTLDHIAVEDRAARPP